MSFDSTSVGEESRGGDSSGGGGSSEGSHGSSSGPRFRKNRVVDMDVPKDAYVKYTRALLRGRHPRSFRPVTAIWSYM